MTVGRYDYLVIGNSAGGIACIEGIRSIDREGTIAAVSDERHQPYGRPLITHLLDGGVTLAGMAYRPRDFYRKAGVTPILGARVEELDLEQGAALLAGRRKIGFGKLLLATGGKPIVPPMPGLDCDGVHTMFSLDDALAVRKRLGLVRRAVVLGGGLIGAKTAEALSHAVEKVTVVELADRLLGPVTDPVTSGMILETFRRNGVEVITGNTVAEIRGAAGVRGSRGKHAVREVLLRDGAILPCDLLIAAIGVTPRTELAPGTGIRLDRGFAVNRNMATSRRNVYACGDAATAWDFVLGGERLLPLWPNAAVGGRVAGLNMAGVPTDYRWATNMNAAVFFRFPVVSAGLLAPPPGRKGYRELVRQEGGSFAKLVLEGDVIRGMVFAGGVSREAGLYLGMMREGTSTGPFAEHLLDRPFSAACLPASLRRDMREPVRAMA
jgi:NADPH-dependent 2,4-dienoyl-CoA reductase/sulfur reductase-like enzyme